MAVTEMEKGKFGDTDIRELIGGLRKDLLEIAKAQKLPEVRTGRIRARAQASPIGVTSTLVIPFEVFRSKAGAPVVPNGYEVEIHNVSAWNASNATASIWLLVCNGWGAPNTLQVLCNELTVAANDVVYYPFHTTLGEGEFLAALFLTKTSADYLCADCAGIWKELR
jgi:hypothetical protein